jgi:hypothetical protein
MPKHDAFSFGAKRHRFRTRAVGSHSGGDGIFVDPHQSPFWIKAMGLLVAE